MNIAFVNSTRRWGGIKTWAMDLGEIAVQRGHKVFVYGRDKRFIDKAEKLGMTGICAHFGSDFNPISIARFYRDFKKRAITHVFVNVGKDLRTAGIAAFLLHLPVIVLVGAPRDFTSSHSRKLVHDIIRPYYLCCSRFIAENIVVNVPYMRDAKIDYLYPGTAMPPEPPHPSRVPYTLITTSQLTPPKHHDDLINGLAILRQKGLDFRLHIVGAGDQELRLRHLVRKHGLKEQVRFLGFTMDVPKELRQADIFVLPTMAEPLGIALEEAMANGLFPLARNSGGAPEIWPEAFRDWLLPADARGEEFAAVLEKVLSTPAERLDEWRSAVQNHARQSFSQEGQYDKFEAYIAGITPSS